MLYPRTGEGISLESQCFRILGCMKNVRIREDGNRLEFWLNTTPTLPESEWLAYKVALEEVPGINRGERGGDVVARIVSDPSGTENCRGGYYDFYYFGTWNQVPQVVWADSYMEMAELQWKRIQMLRK